MRKRKTGKRRKMGRSKVLKRPGDLVYKVRVLGRGRDGVKNSRRSVVNGERLQEEGGEEMSSGETPGQDSCIGIGFRNMGMVSSRARVGME